MVSGAEEVGTDTGFGESFDAISKTNLVNAASMSVAREVAVERTGEKSLSLKKIKKSEDPESLLHRSNKPHLTPSPSSPLSLMTSYSIYANAPL